MAAGDVTSSIQVCGSNGAALQENTSSRIDLIDSSINYFDDEITLSVWVMKNGTNGSSIYEGLVGRYIDFAIMYKNSTDQLRVYGSNTTGWGGEVIIIGPPGNFNDDKFHHVCVTYDGTTTTLYYDGVSIATSGIMTGSIKNTNHYSGWVAGYYYGLANSSLLGYLRDIKMFDRCLTSSEVEKLSRGGYVSPNLMGEWKFNGNTADTSGYSNDATLVGGRLVVGPEDDINGSNVDSFLTSARVTANDRFFITSLAEKDKVVIVGIEEAP